MNASIRNVFLASTLSLFAVAGCDDNRTATNDRGTTPNNNYSDTGDPTNPADNTFAVPRNDTDPAVTPNDDPDRLDAQPKTLQGEAEVLGMLTAIDKEEIHASSEALKKDLSAPVKQFAQMLHTDHAANLEKTMRLAQEVKVEVGSPAKAEQMLQESKSKIAELAKQDGEAFERAFIKEMIRGHMNALSMIDNQLLTSAKNAEVKAHLEQAREKVAAHLKHAQQIQDEFDTNGAAPQDKPLDNTKPIDNNRPADEPAPTEEK